MEKTLTVQQEAVRVFNRFDSIDFSNCVEVAKFLNDLQPYTTNNQVSLSLKELNQMLLDAGYLPNVFLGDKFDPNNKEIFARYLIGQAMDTLGNPEWVMILPVYVHHFADFKERFNIQ